MRCMVGEQSTSVLFFFTQPSDRQRGTVQSITAQLSSLPPLIEACWGSFVWKPNKHHSHMCPLWLDEITDPTSQLWGFFHCEGGRLAKPCHAMHGCQMWLLFHVKHSKVKLFTLPYHNKSLSPAAPSALSGCLFVLFLPAIFKTVVLTK